MIPTQCPHKSFDILQLHMSKKMVLFGPGRVLIILIIVIFEERIGRK